MGRINVKIPEALHDELRNKSNEIKVPIKYLVIKAIENEHGRSG